MKCSGQLRMDPVGYRMLKHFLLLPKCISRAGPCPPRTAQVSMDHTRKSTAKHRLLSLPDGFPRRLIHAVYYHGMVDVFPHPKSLHNSAPVVRPVFPLQHLSESTSSCRAFLHFINPTSPRRAYRTVLESGQTPPQQRSKTLLLVRCVLPLREKKPKRNVLKTTSDFTCDHFKPSGFNRRTNPRSEPCVQ